MAKTEPEQVATAAQAPAGAGSAGIPPMTEDQFQRFMAAILSNRGPAVDNDPMVRAIVQSIERQSEATNRLSQELSRTVRRSNAAHPNISAFTYDKRCDYCKAKKPHPVLDADGRLVPDAVGPLAHPKPKLVHETLLCGIPIHAEQLTPFEVELVNQFTDSRSTRGGAWEAIVRRDGRKSRLMIQIPARTLDEMQDLPRTLPEVLSELLYGEEALDAQNMLAELNKLHKRIQELEAAALKQKSA